MICSRIARLRASLSKDENFIVSDLTNVRYLCGFTGSNGALLITPDVAFLVTDSRYQEQAKNQTSDVEILIDRDLLGALVGRAAGFEILIEAEHISVGTFNKVSERFPDIKFTPTFKKVESLRVVKDESELELISTACAISTQALHAIQDSIRLGESERDIALRLENKMRQLGADDKAFDTIVASGPNSAIPHHEPTERLLEQGDLVKIDFGAKLAGYHADCTRTFVIGKATSQQQEIYQAVQQAQAAGRKALKSGVALAEVVSAVMGSFKNADLAAKFTHGLGHGVGLQIHEDPFFSPANNAKIEANTVITVEPGVYLPGIGGVRIEDTVVVTDEGYRNLTEFSYELIEL